MRARALLLAAVLVLTLVPAPAAAARAGGTVVVGPNETVDGFSAYAGRVVVEGTVEGDLTAYAGRVVVAEGGTVTGRVRAYAGSVVVNGTVGGNVLAYTGSVTVSEGAVVRGSLGAGIADVNVAGTVRGDVIVAGNVTLADSARVTGDLTYNGQLNDRGGRVDGEVRQLGDLALFPGVPPLVVALYLLLADALLGGLLLWAFPEFSWGAANTAHAEPARTAVAGIAVALVVPLACLLLALTVVGVPLAVVGLGAYVATLWVGSVYGRFAVGSWLLTFVDEDRPPVALAVGLVVVAVAAQVPVVGDVVRLVVVLLGVGVLALGLRAVYDIVQSHRGGLTSL